MSENDFKKTYNGFTKFVQTAGVVLPVVCDIRKFLAIFHLDMAADRACNMFIRKFSGSRNANIQKSIFLKNPKWRQSKMAAKNRIELHFADVSSG